MHAPPQKTPHAEASGHKPSGAATAAHKNQAHPLQTLQPAAATLQPGLVINAPGDALESEADRLAKRVMRMPLGRLRRACACDGGCPRCSKKTSVRERVQTRRAVAQDKGEGVAPPVVHEVLRSSGQSLDTATRSFMESRFGHDFSNVRVHTDSQAAESARAVQAAAYTVGRDVVFGAGRYAPETSEGRFLLAHELTHVLQQEFGSSVTVRRLSRTPENHCTRAVMGVDNSDQIIEAMIQEAIGMVDLAMFRMRAFQRREWWLGDEDYYAVNFLFSCPNAEGAAFILEKLREMRILLMHRFPYVCVNFCVPGRTLLYEPVTLAPANHLKTLVEGRGFAHRTCLTARTLPERLWSLSPPVWPDSLVQMNVIDLTARHRMSHSRSRTQISSTGMGGTGQTACLRRLDLQFHRRRLCLNRESPPDRCGRDGTSSSQTRLTQPPARISLRLRLKATSSRARIADAPDRQSNCPNRCSMKGLARSSRPDAATSWRRW